MILRSRLGETDVKEDPARPQQTRLLEEQTRYPALAHEMACTRSPAFKQQRHPVKVNGHEYEHIWESPLPLPNGNGSIKTDIHCTIQTHTLPRRSRDNNNSSFSTFKSPDPGRRTPDPGNQEATTPGSIKGGIVNGGPLYLTSKDVVPILPLDHRELIDTARYSTLDSRRGFNLTPPRRDLWSV